jgi:hypothetical protein
LLSVSAAHQVLTVPSVACRLAAAKLASEFVTVAIPRFALRQAATRGPVPRHFTTAGRVESLRRRMPPFESFTNASINARRYGAQGVSRRRLRCANPTAPGAHDADG